MENGKALAIPLNIFSDVRYHYVKLSEEATSHAFGASLGKVIKKSNVLLIEEKMMLLL
jgi:hypothetical protein